MIERFLLAGLLWCVIGAGFFLCRRESPLNLLVLAFAFTGLIGSFFPITTSFVEPMTWRNVSQVAEPQLHAVQRDYLAFALGLFAAGLLARNFGWMKRRPHDEESKASAYGRHRDRFVVAGLFALGAALYSVWVAKVGLGAITNRNDFAAKYLASEGLNTFKFGLQLMILSCLWAEGSEVPTGTKRLFRLIGVGIAVWTIAFMSIRINFVILFLGYVYIGCSRRGFELRRLRPSILLLGLLLWVGLETFARVRGQLDQGLTRATTLFVEHIDVAVANVVGGSELAHPFITTLEVEGAKAGGELMGRSYLDSLLSVPPRFIAPNRPTSLSEGFAEEFYPFLKDRGGGTNFSVVAEAWWNFGHILGPFLVAACIGLLLCQIEHLRRARPHGLCARVAPYLVFLVVILQRSEAAIFTKQVFTMMAFVWMLAAVSGFTWSARRRSSTPTTVRAIEGAGA